jgi:hypothetical protein
VASIEASSRARAVGALAAIVVTLGLSACGSGDDSSGQTSDQDKEAAATTTAGDSQGTPKEEVEAFIVGMQKDFVAGDGESFCDRLTAAGRQDAGKFGQLIGRGSTCETMVRATAQANREGGIPTPPNKIVSIQITGDRATAVVRTGDRPPGKIKLVNQGGQWKLPDPGFTKALPGPTS